MHETTPTQPPSAETSQGIGRRGLFALPLTAALTACERVLPDASSPTLVPSTTIPAEATTTAVAPPSTVATELLMTPLTVDDDDPDAHLARRVTFGVTADLLGAIEEQGSEAWLDDQLHPDRLDTTGVDAKIAALPALAIADPTETLQTYLATQTSGQARLQLQLGTVIRAVESPAQLYERMVEFWSDHFNVPVEGQYLGVMRHHLDLDLRAHALGNFADLLLAATRSPAMMEYLDNYKSRANAINENFARELLELHTVGVNGPYNEDDVVDTARLLTGWFLFRREGRFGFVDRFHDAGPVDIMGWTRPTGTDHEAHGVAFLRWLAVHPDTATFVSTKIARRFVSDDPPSALVDAMAAAWLANDAEIVPVLRAMFDHDAFAAAGRQKYNRPLDFTYALLRRLGAEITPTTGTGELRALARALEALGQIPMTWPAPDGFPDTEAAWLNTGAMLNRWNFVGDIVSGQGGAVGFDGAALVDDLAGLEASAVLGELSRRLAIGTLTNEGRQLLLDHAGWSAAEVPTTAALGASLGGIAVALLGAPKEMYR